MPILVKPTNDASRLNFLTTSVSTGKSDFKSGNRYLSEELLKQSGTVADEFIDETIAELEFNLRKLDPSNKRRIMRSYGVTYKYAAGEPEDVPTPPATETK